jgi:hypothetical protein
MSNFSGTSRPVWKNQVREIIKLVIGLNKGKGKVVPVPD